MLPSVFEAKLLIAVFETKIVLIWTEMTSREQRISIVSPYHLAKAFTVSICNGFLALQFRHRPHIITACITRELHNRASKR